MAGNLGKWPSKRGPISKITPSEGRGRDAVPLAVGWWYDFPEFGRHLGNVGLYRESIGWLDSRRAFLRSTSGLFVCNDLG